MNFLKRLFSRSADSKLEFFVPGPESEGLLPSKAYEGDMGWDFKSPADVVIPPGGVIKINTSVIVKLPTGYGMLLKTRSSMAAKGIAVLGGVIDNKYRGQIIVVLANHTNEPFTIMKDSKIAQGILQNTPIFSVAKHLEYPEENSDGNERGSKGFGSSDR